MQVTAERENNTNNSPFFSSLKSFPFTLVKLFYLRVLIISSIYPFLIQFKKKKKVKFSLTFSFSARA